ncbi:VWA domain-containing protein [Nakamurella sp. YIM 132087]|uniref:VWA domain-containing protein n=1 Tax=Nakamurella alba TaxID=2665158 RepID=A0A7K1FTD9_9ACTN|nr:vWA domain-containing protein [Nakamurella alba]MTD16064.1 VWA domain-containing protein [Nakamurella alba]
MTDKDLTHLYVLLDRSGSMQSIRTDTVGGFAAFVEQQKSAPGRCLVTLAQFDDHYEIVYRDKDVNDVGELDLQPRGSTALLDSMGRLITEAGAELAALSEAQRPSSVIVVVMTDGLENASREWTPQAIRALVEQQRSDYQWVFTYLGANQDAIAVGEGLGVHRDFAMTFTGRRARTAMRSAGANVAAYRTAVAGGAPPVQAAPALAWSDAQRADARAEDTDDEN